MLPESSHTNSESLAQISTPMAEIQNLFYRGLFFIGAPCRQLEDRATDCLNVLTLIQSVSLFFHQVPAVLKSFFYVVTCYLHTTELSLYTASM